MSNIRHAFLFLCNQPSNSALNTFQDICCATKGAYNHTSLLYHFNNDKVPQDIKDVEAYYFTDEVLNRLGYTPLGDKLVPGNNHFPLLKFFKEFPDYDFYWCIEDDVRFTGDWAKLFNAFNNNPADFISSHIQRYKEEPQWPWWDTLKFDNYTLSLDKRLKSFNPVYRISKDALLFIDESLKDGWCGHHEVLFPTLLENVGFKLLDFGGQGEFVPTGKNNEFYIGDYKNSIGLDNSKSTFKWRPVFSEVGNLKNKLYHPVKD